MFSFFKKIKSIISNKLFNKKTSETRFLSYLRDENKELRFVEKFSFFGGRFLYCESNDQIFYFLKKIIIENNINKFWCPDIRLQNYFKSFSLNFQKNPDKDYFNLIYCEYLIAKDGSIIISSDQIGSWNIDNISNNFIILASNYQIVDTVDNALLRIKTFKSKNTPNNINSIKGPNKYDSFYSESHKKNIYLLFTDNF